MRDRIGRFSRTLAEAVAEQRVSFAH